MKDITPIITELKNKQYRPIYFLSGDEPYFMDQVSDYIANNVLTDSEKDFNQHLLYGSDVDVAKVDLLARRYPMGASKQVVIVKEAQNIKNIDLLLGYVQEPVESTILVINYKGKKLDGRSKLTKALQAKKSLYTFECLRDYEVPKWVAAYLKQKGYAVEPKAALLIAESLGENLSKITKELDKLIIALGANGGKIAPNDVERNIGLSKDYNVFELQKALIYKDAQKAYKIVRVFAKNPKQYPIQSIVPLLFSYFSKLFQFYYLTDKSQKNAQLKLKISTYAYKDYIQGTKSFSGVKVMNIISYLRDCDMKSKGFGGAGVPPGELLQELVFKILH